MEDEELKPPEIRQRLKKKLGKRYAAILAERAGMSQPWVSRHIAGTLKTDNGRKLLARALGVKLCQIFP